MNTNQIKIFNKIRNLPLMILIGCALLFLKVHDVLFELEHQGVFITQAFAKTDKASDKQSSSAIAGDIGEETEKEDHNESNATITENNDEFSILSLTPERVEIFKKLFERRKEIEAQKGQLDKKISTLLAIERRIDEKIKTLNEIKSHVQQLVERREDIEKKAIDKLVAMYEKMKPKEAADILEGLDIETLIDLMSNFREMKASAILANMTREKARVVTMELMNRRKIDGFHADIPDLALNVQ